MTMEKATALVLKTTDWSESSRIATLWTRELGKVRVLAKGGRRLRSSFESALDLLTVCSIVLLRKSSGSLDLLTEAQVVRRFPRLRSDLTALYAAYYVAELLGDWTQELDPHPRLFDEAVDTLAALGGDGEETGLRVMRFETTLLHELGFRPALEHCAGCQTTALAGKRLAFSPTAGGILCPGCQRSHRDHWPVSELAYQLLRALASEALPGPWPAAVRAEVRLHLGNLVTSLRGRPPRMLPYLGS